MFDLADVSPETFVPHTGSTFSVADAGQGVSELVLLAVEPAGEAMVPDARDPFVLIFGARGAHALGQGIQSLDHEQLGEIELFLVPIAPEGGDARYQAVFS
jgi:hypothetical protein